jgi:hypothetical protein
VGVSLYKDCFYGNLYVKISHCVLRAELGDNGEHEDDERRGQVWNPTPKTTQSASPGTGTSSKKNSPDESLFAWFANNEVDTTVLTPNQELTCKLVQNHALDIKTTKCMVLGSKCVPEFPDSKWNNVLAGKAVNHNVVFSGMYSTVMDN